MKELKWKRFVIGKYHNPVPKNLYPTSGEGPRKLTYKEEKRGGDERWGKS